MRPPLVPPPEYTGDQPTVPNPIYREPARSAAGSSGQRGGAPPGGASEVKKGPSPSPVNDGRRGNVVIGLMLVAGLAVTGAAGVMLNGASGDAAEESGETAADRGAGSGTPLAVARPQGGDDEGSAGSGDGAGDGERMILAGSPANEAPAGFGETVSLEDGVEVTMGRPQPFTPSSDVDVDADEFLSVEITVVNGAERSYEVQPAVQLLDDLSDLGARGVGVGPDDAGAGPSSGYEAVRDPGNGLTASWNGASMDPGETAYGIFGFALPTDAPDEIYGVVWIEAGDDELLYVTFTGPRP